MILQVNFECNGLAQETSDFSRIEFLRWLSLHVLQRMPRLREEELVQSWITEDMMDGL